MMDKEGCKKGAKAGEKVKKVAKKEKKKGKKPKREDHKGRKGAAEQKAKKATKKIMLFKGSMDKKERGPPKKDNSTRGPPPNGSDDCEYKGVPLTELTKCERMDWDCMQKWGKSKGMKDPCPDDEEECWKAFA